MNLPFNLTLAGSLSFPIILSHTKACTLNVHIKLSSGCTLEIEQLAEVVFTVVGQLPHSLVEMTLYWTTEQLWTTGVQLKPSRSGTALMRDTLLGE